MGANGLGYYDTEYCPECGGNLSTTPVPNKYTCTRCRTSFDIEELDWVAYTEEELNHGA